MDKLDVSKLRQKGYNDQQIQEVVNVAKQKGAQVYDSSVPDRAAQAEPGQGFEWVDLLPVAGAVVGGLTPLGPIAGSAVGAGVGTLAKQALDKKEGFQADEVVKETALGAVGGVVGKGVGMIGSKFLPKIASKGKALSEGLKEGTRQIKQPASVFGANKEKAINATLNKYGFKGTADQQYESLQPTMQQIEGKIKQIIDNNPNLSVSFDSVKSSFLTKLQSSIRSGDLTKKQATDEIYGYLNDLMRAAGYGGSGTLPRLTARAGEKGLGDIPLSVLRQLKKLVNEDYGPVYKAMERGTALSPRQKVVAAAWSSLDDAVKNVSPEIKDLLTDESNLYKAASSLSGARTNPPTLRVMGTSIPQSVTQKGRDLLSDVTAAPYELGKKMPGQLPPIIPQATTQSLVRLPFIGGEQSGQPDQGVKNDTQNQSPYGPQSYNQGYNAQENQQFQHISGDDTTTMGQSQYITGYSPQELMNGYLKAIQAGDKTSAAYIEDLYNKELKHQESSGGKMSEATKKELLKIDGAEQIANQIENAISQIGATGRIVGLGQQATGALGTNPRASTYESLRLASIAPLARAISGEVGALTDRDVARAEGLLPKLTDTPEEIQIKLQQLRSAIEEKRQSVMSLSSQTDSSTTLPVITAY